MQLGQFFCKKNHRTKRRSYFVEFNQRVVMKNEGKRPGCFVLTPFPPPPPPPPPAVLTRILTSPLWWGGGVESVRGGDESVGVWISGGVNQWGGGLLNQWGGGGLLNQWGLGARGVWGVNRKDPKAVFVSVKQRFQCRKIWKQQRVPLKKISAIRQKYFEKNIPFSKHQIFHI